ncbi:MAG: hypothetical protein CR982_10170 [Candidatus Cloacimonadota bacterium]|nr:MAG: hypothetical protein CR982_10170 [Candidatus Cloacimonadota bacterium]PIE78515.1 MAG: hypothetical protein CSA15_07420 [Candidatus Delongbacteria bacterium]
MLNKFFIFLFILLGTVYSQNVPFYPSKIIESQSGDFVPLRNMKYSTSFGVYYGNYRISDNPDFENVDLYYLYSNQDNNNVSGISRTLKFLENFKVVKVDEKNRSVTLFDPKISKNLSISFEDVEKHFIWQNQIAVANRMYMPLIAFTSLSAEAKDGIRIRKSPSDNGAIRFDKDIFEYDAYKILDLKNDHYLIAELTDMNYLSPDPEYCGVIGWVKKENVVFWNSRMYQKILNDDYLGNLKYSNLDNMGAKDHKVLKNLFINTESYINSYFPRGMNNGDVIKRKFLEFYKNGGAFYSGITTYSLSSNVRSTPVTVFNNFDQSVLNAISNNIKSNIYSYFLIDRSNSTKNLTKFVDTFLSTFRTDEVFKKSNVKTRVFSYLESNRIKRHYTDDPYKDITWGGERFDKTYKEKLLQSLDLLIEKVNKENNNQNLLKTIFIITDAGDSSPGDMDDYLNIISKKARNYGINLVFIYPDSFIDKIPPSHMVDTPREAYENLNKIISGLENRLNSNPKVKIVTKYTIKAQNSSSKYSYNRAVDEILGNYKKVLKSWKHPQEKPEIVLNENMLKLFNNVRKNNQNLSSYRSFTYVHNDEKDDKFFEQRIAIDRDLIVQLKSRISSPRALPNFNNKLKKLIVLNNLYGFKDLASVDKRWTLFQKRAEKFQMMGELDDYKLYKAYTGYDVARVEINNNLSSIIYDLDPTERQFSFNVSYKIGQSRAERSSYIFLKLNEFFNR